jgi:predicted DCC family thiol-disulfide oxidoreductase YuxK
VAIETPIRPTPIDSDRAAGSESLTVLFDGECSLCRETVRQLRRWDHGTQFEFMPYQAAASSGRPVLERMAAENAFTDEIQVVDESTGRTVSGGHAALAILDRLPGGWLLRPWAALPATALAADAVYRVARRHRDRLAWLVGMPDEVACPLRPVGPGRPNRTDPS